MALCYKKLWKLLIDKDMTRAANVLERICESLQCNIGDIVDYVPKSVGQGSGKGKAR